MNTLNDSAFLQLVLWHSADAVRRKVCVSGLKRRKWSQQSLTKDRPGCNGDSRGFHIPASSTWLSGSGRRTSPSGRTRTALWNEEAKREL